MSVDGPWTSILRIKMREKWQSWSQVTIAVVKTVLREKFNIIWFLVNGYIFPRFLSCTLVQYQDLFINELGEKHATPNNTLGLSCAHRLTTWHKAPFVLIPIPYTQMIFKLNKSKWGGPTGSTLFPHHPGSNAPGGGSYSRGYLQETYLIQKIPAVDVSVCISLC